jgi:hypothetical protein
MCRSGTLTLPLSLSLFVFNRACSLWPVVLDDFSIDGGAISPPLLLMGGGGGGGGGGVECAR